MCDLCRLDGVDYQFRNGRYGNLLYQRKIYSAFKYHVVTVKLCFLHDLELYLAGEERFVHNNPKLQKFVTSGKGKIEEKNAPFGNSRVVF